MICDVKDIEFNHVVTDLHRVYIDGVYESLCTIIEEIAYPLNCYFEFNENKVINVYTPETMEYHDSIFLKSISADINKITLQKVMYTDDAYTIFIKRVHGYKNATKFPTGYVLNEYSESNYENVLSVYIFDELTDKQKISMTYDIIDCAIANTFREYNIPINSVCIYNIHRPLVIVDTYRIELYTSIFISIYYYMLYKAIKMAFPSISCDYLLEVESDYGFEIYKILSSMDTSYMFYYNIADHGDKLNDLYSFIHELFYNRDKEV